MKYTTLNGNIIVKQIEVETITKSGLHVTATETRGKKDIVAGRIIHSNRNDLKIGEVVYYPMFAAQPFNLDGNDVAVINSKDIVLVKRSDD